MRQDLRHSIRMLLKNPGLTLVAVLSLALGISATTTIFSAIDAILLRPSPYPASDRLVSIGNTSLKQPGNLQGVSTTDLVRWRKENSVFDQIELSRWGAEMNALSGAGVLERIGLQYVTPRPVSLARRKANSWPRPYRAGCRAPRLHVPLSATNSGNGISQATAVSLGRSFFVDYDGVIVGAVLPPGFDLFGSVPADVYRLIPANAPDNERWLTGLGRLKPGITIQQAQASMNVLARHLEQTYPDSNKGLGIKVESLQAGLFGWSRQILYPLFAAVAFVLLIAITIIATYIPAFRATKVDPMVTLRHQ
jgi:putative ABC transport system permease protein